MTLPKRFLTIGAALAVGLLLCAPLAKVIATCRMVCSMVAGGFQIRSFDHS